MYHFVEPFKRFLAALEAQYLPLVVSFVFGATLEFGHKE